ncbi:unnamed protein product, partial [marine sediment metagenome]
MSFFKTCEIKTLKTTKFIIIPDNFIFIYKLDSILLKNYKFNLQYYIAKLAWSSVEGYRNLWWHLKEINKTHTHTKNEFYLTTIYHHLNEVNAGRSFGLRPLHKDDGIIYEFQLELIKKFYESNILNLYFPGILIYSKLPKENYLCVSLNSPAFAILLDQTQRAQLRKKIDMVSTSDRESNSFFKNKSFYNPKPGDAAIFKKTEDMVKNYLQKSFLNLIKESEISDFNISEINVHLPEYINFVALIKLWYFLKLPVIEGLKQFVKEK